VPSCIILISFEILSVKDIGVFTIKPFLYSNIVLM
jgi:hypothetical protein